MTSIHDYRAFLERKSHTGGEFGFAPIFLPEFLFDFQKHLVDWAIRRGRAAIFADCGLGKTPMQLVWAQNIVERTNKPVLIITPLAVTSQTVREGEKFGVNCYRSPDGNLRGGASIVVTNYEKLHYFNPEDFEGVVCDESSAIKNFEGERQKLVTEFLRTRPYRLLCTATAAPNDFIELGTSAEALGEMGRMDMLGMFFRNDENSLHPIWWGSRWQLKSHAQESFWRWVCSWGRSVRKPSDLGFDDGPFLLPPLTIRETVIENNSPKDGQLFTMPAVTLDEQREERRATLAPRCEAVAEKVNGTSSPAVVWCHLNSEGDLLEKLIPDARQVSGADSDEEKEESFTDFSEGRLRVLVTKPKIGALGMNWQHCSHQTFFPSHSFEQFYQSVRRCWRFGQTRPVVIDIVTTEGEVGVMKNLQRKADQADEMFSMIVAHMNNSLSISKSTDTASKVSVPEWL